MERETSKLVPSFFLKLFFFCVFATDFCCPPRSSGLALNKGHEKRWHLSMARRLHGAIGHGAMCGGRRERLLDWGTWCFGHWAVGWRRISASFVGGGELSEVRREKENCQAKSAWNASCIYLAVRIRPPSALTSSPTTVGGVCTYV